jgi:alkaline phosphatase
MISIWITNKREEKTAVQTHLSTRQHVGQTVPVVQSEGIHAEAFEVKLEQEAARETMRSFLQCTASPPP